MKITVTIEYTERAPADEHEVVDILNLLLSEGTNFTQSDVDPSRIIVKAVRLGCSS